MSRYSKFIAAALAFAGVVIASGLLSGSAQAWASCIVSAIGAALVYVVPNAEVPAPAKRVAKRTEAGQIDPLYALVVVILAVVLVWLLLSVVR